MSAGNIIWKTGVGLEIRFPCRSKTTGLFLTGKNGEFTVTVLKPNATLLGTVLTPAETLLTGFYSLSFTPDATGPWTVKITQADMADIGLAYEVKDRDLNELMREASYTAPDNAGIDTIETAIAAIQAKTDALPVDPASEAAVQGFVTDVFNRVGAPAGASVSADVAAIKTVVDSVKTKTDGLPADPASQAAVEAAIDAIPATDLTPVLDAVAAIPATDLTPVLTAIEDLETTVEAIPVPDNSDVLAAIEAVSAIALITEKLTKNNKYLNPDTGVLTVFEEDGTTLFMSFQCYDRNDNPSARNVVKTTRIP